MNNIEVAIAVIYHQGQFLLSRRAKDVHLAGKLEFVGGKIEAGEKAKQALLREVAEELGVDISSQKIEKMGKIHHHYVDDGLNVCLFVYQVALDEQLYQMLAGRSTGCQNQMLIWLDKNELINNAQNLPKANGEILGWIEEGF